MTHFISLAAAKQMAARYAEHRETILTPPMQNKDILPLSERFERADIDSVLAQEGCAGLRIYYGMDEDLQVHAILIGVDENGEDILPEDETTEEDSDVLERGFRCPPYCPDKPLFP